MQRVIKKNIIKYNTTKLHKFNKMNAKNHINYIIY